MTLRCRLARPFLVSSAADGHRLPSSLAAHHGRCLRCQAVTARTRATVRELRSLSRDMPPGPFEGSTDGRGAGMLAPMAAGAAVTLAVLVVKRRLLNPA